MQTHILLPTWMATEEAASVFHALLEAGGQARFVGGCVRNALLEGMETDIDIATTLKPEATIKALQAQQIKAIPTGIKHGTITAVIGKAHFEITTLRRDVACYGRHAEVEYTDDWQEDAARRDFTINAMSCAPDGELFDYFGGMHDVHAGIVRFVGDADNRVQEDVLRILRFFRFYAYYGQGNMHTESLKACARHADKIHTLSGERIQAEMMKLLKSPSPLPTVEVMEAEGILAHVLPHFAQFVALKQLIRIAPEHEERGLLRLAILLRSSKQKHGAVAELTARWRLSNKDSERLQHWVEPAYALLPDLDAAIQKKILRYLGKELFEGLVFIAWAEAQANDPDNSAAYERSFREMITLAESWEIPVFPLSGKDLLSIGLKPGKDLGDLLRDAEQWWEEGGYQAGKGALLGWVRERVEE